MGVRQPGVQGKSGTLMAKARKNARKATAAGPETAQAAPTAKVKSERAGLRVHLKIQRQNSHQHKQEPDRVYKTNLSVA